MLRALTGFETKVSRAVLAVAAWPALLPAQQPGTGTVAVTVALVAEELQVRPVPLFKLALVKSSDTTVRIELQTGLDGRGSQIAPPGEYRVRSVAPARLAGKAYSWNVPARVVGRKTVMIELTNANAIVDSSATEAIVRARQIAPEIAVYEQVKASVVRVEAGLKHGSGFFISALEGVIVTNDHVITGERGVSVALDSTRRVPAQVIVRDHDADLALLRINPSGCPGCRGLPMARAGTGGAIVVPGERVIAVGFPLSQQSSVTSGIVSSVRERAIISDVNINPGNSGGPLLNLAGEVVGVNTFGEQAGHGPGISGSILISRVEPLLQRAADTMPSLPVPDLTPLPVLGGPAYALAEIRAAAESVPPDAYDDVQELKAGNFLLSFSTPVANFVYLKMYEAEIAKDRRKREARAGLGEEERYSEVGALRHWIDYVGEVTKPAVSVQVVPRAGETFSSRALSASQGRVPRRAKYKFKGDVQDVEWYRNGVPISAVYGGRTPLRADVENEWVEMKDVAYRGLYVFTPETFAPDSTGAPPSIVAHIYDLKHPDDLNLEELPARVVARIWNDFGPYYARVHRGRGFIPADPERFKSALGELCRRVQCDSQ